MKTRKKTTAEPKIRNAADLTGRNNNARKREIAELRESFEAFVVAVHTRVRALELRLDAIDARLTKVGVD